MKTKDNKFRKMLVDSLRYIKHTSGYWVIRDTIEVHEDTIDTSNSGVSLEELIEDIDPKDYKHIFLRGAYTQDYEGYDGSQIEIYSFRKQTDQEYFDTTCEYMLPTEYQVSQYQTYLQLKKMFEGNKV